MSPRVSVVLAVRDDPRGLRASAESILAQTEGDLELVVVDDGSRDETGAAAFELASRDGRVRVLAAPGQGLTSALRLGCEQARAPLIARQDAGDLSSPGRLESQLDLLRRRPEAVFVSCWTEVVGPEGEPLQIVTGGCAPEDAIRLDPGAVAELESIGPTSHGSVVFRREAYELAGGYRREFRLAQDWDLWWRLAERGAFACVPSPLYQRRIAPGSISLDHARHQKQLGALAREAARLRRAGGDERPVLRRAEKISISLASRPPASARAAARGLYFIGSLLRERHDARARGYFREAVRHNPLLLRAWIRWLQPMR